MKKVLYGLIFIIAVLFLLKNFGFFNKFFEYPKLSYNDDGSATYDFKFFDNSSIIFPKSQSDGQNLSVIIKNDIGDLIIIDGGRKEDADYLTEIILNNGGRVKAWYLTHIHDDHIGAIFEILKRKDFKIIINNLYYNFADFDWYKEKIGIDAGALKVFKDALHDYNEFAISSKNFDYLISSNDVIRKGDTYTYDNVVIKALNDMFTLDSDPINNTSIVYKVYINDKTMIVYGDLGYEGGERLLNESSFDDLKADIICLSHHGQNAVDKKVYEASDALIAVWPTTKKIYENESLDYKTDETKKWIEELGIKYEIFTFLHTAILK